MKKIFTLFLCILHSIFLLAAEPTVPSSNFIFSNVEGARYLVRFTAGNGSSRIVVMKAGSAVTGVPANGTEYTANNAFGTANTQFTANGEYVVYKGTSNNFTVSNLLPNTTYHLAVFEYNGTGITTQYLLVSLTGSQSTAVTPTIQTNTISFTAITGNSVKANWLNGNGEGRVVIARKNSPVNALPVDLTEYISSADFGSGTVLNGDNYIVYKASGNNTTFSALEPNTTYHFAFFERNGSTQPVYLRPGATTSITTNAGPTVQTLSLSFSGQEGNRFSINASRGNGSRRLYIMRKGAAVTAVPINGTSYTGNTSYGAGTQIAPGEYVVNAAEDISVMVTNLEPATVYHVRSFEYDVDAAGNTYYLTTNPAIASFSTAAAPTPVSNINFTSVTGNSFTVKYTSGNGSYRVVIMKESSPVDAVPQNLRRYSGNTSFGNGEQIGTGNYVVNGGANGTQTTVTNLRPGYTYYLAIYEMNGNNYPVYSTPVTASITMPAEPTVASTAFTKTLIEGNAFRAGWNNGDGSRRIVIARKDVAVTAAPVDGTTYTANSNFGSGTAILPGQFIVYDGTAGVVDIKNLEINSTYHVAVFEYNSPAGSPDYLTSSFLAGNATTLAAPTTQVTNINPVTVTSTSVSLGYNPGNGNGRMFIMREGSPVNIEPTDLGNYSASANYGNQEIGSGNYIVQKATNTANFTVNNLAPNTTYYVAAFEYNGTNGPVFKKPGAVTSFTTSTGTVVVAPTVAAASPVFSAIEGNKLTLRWDNGNGASRMVIAKAGSAVSAQPVNGNTYIADANFGSGTAIGSNEFVVFNGNGNTAALTNLVPGTAYHFAVYEYNGSGVNTKYLVNSYLAANTSTLSAPTTGSTNANKSSTANSFTLNWQSGNGGGRLVIVKEGSAVLSTPTDLSVYPANSVFGNGAQTGVGEYVVYSGSGNSVTVTGLTANKTYYFSILEFNGSTGPVYNTTQILSGNVSVGGTLPVTWLYFTGTDNDGKVLLKWGTATELQSAYFVVEKSINGNNFISIDTVIAAGNSASDKHYSYTDHQPGNGHIQYRLKQVDVDKRFIYSAVVTLDMRGAVTAFSFYPNPATDAIKLVLPEGVQKSILKIYDLKGVLVQQQNVSVNTAINISQLSPGVYYLTIEDSKNKLSAKMIKQ